MTVVDLDPIAAKTVVIYNTDVAASATVANSFCDFRGIPRGNQIGFAMGTDVDVWAYDASRFANFWTLLYNKVNTLGARAVVCAAGVPNFMYCKEFGNEANTAAKFYLHSGVGLVKLVYADGFDPLTKDNSGGAGNWQVYKGSGTGAPGLGASWKTESQWTGYISLTPPARWTAGKTAAGATHADNGTGSNNFFITPASFDRDYSRFTVLPSGYAGYWPGRSGAWPADLATKSTAIFGRASRGEDTLANVKGKRIVIGIGNYGTAGYDRPDTAARSALLVPLLRDAGFTDVRYWWQTGITDALAENFASSGSQTFAEAAVSGGTADQTSIFMAFGQAWQNSTSWSGEFAFATGGICQIGASDDDLWVQTYMDTAGFCGGIASANHNTANVTPMYYETLTALLSGMTMAEAAFWNGQNYYQTAYGDPLYRPVRV